MKMEFESVLFSKRVHVGTRTVEQTEMNRSKGPTGEINQTETKHRPESKASAIIQIGPDKKPPPGRGLVQAARSRAELAPASLNMPRSKIQINFFPPPVMCERRPVPPVD